MTKVKVSPTDARGLPKCPTGIQGLDEITFGGLPKGRPTLVCGGAGCGKTLMAMEFLYRGATQFNEPGVFMAFEEKERDLTENFTSLGFDLPALQRKKMLAIDYVNIERSEIEETGEYDLEGLFVRLDSAISSIKAKRVVLDTVEALFSGFSNESILRAELRRLFRWLKEREVTAIVTGEKGDQTLTKHGLEEYVADCVIYLDHRVNEQRATRRLKVIKYRGSRHGTNEYPFLIGENGVSVFPITSLFLASPAFHERISTGIGELDAMLEGKGYYRGTAALVSGSSGSGKTSVLAQFVNAACASGKRALFFTYEESPQQIFRNMKSIGLHLGTWADKGLLTFSANRGTLGGLEMHLVLAHNLIRAAKPDVVVIDPISNLIGAGTLDETKAMLARLLDFIKSEGITLVATDLTARSANWESDTEVGISSLVDTWISLAMEVQGYTKIRKLNILKARGINHSHDFRELVISGTGLSLRDLPAHEGGRE